MPHDTDEHRLREDARHRRDECGVERRLVAPSSLAAFRGVPREHAGVELANPRVELSLVPAEPAVPVAAVAPLRYAFRRGDGAHETRLRPDGDAFVTVEDEAEQC